MTSVLLVHHDIDLADQEADSLRRLGYDVIQCLASSSAYCPIPAGRDCPSVEAADVLVYDAWATGEPGGAWRLVKGLRDRYPAIPLVVCATGMEPDWVDAAALPGVVPLVGMLTGARLAEAIERARSQAPRPH